MGLTIVGCISSEDPLADVAVELVVDHAEEDNYVDYKKTFVHTEEHHWLEISKDVMAFANTSGGYLVFGVADGIFNVVGLTEDVEKILLDINQVQMKVNRFLDPEIALMRARQVTREGKSVVVWFIPQSSEVTHVFKKDGAFVHRSGKSKTAFRKGTLYVRRSAANHLADSRDLDSIFDRRLEKFREQIMGRIARVVEAPVEKHVLLVSLDESDETTQKYVIDDAPDSIAIRGMSFSVTPSTPVQEVSGWIAMSKSAGSAVPPKKILWNWYHKRDELLLTPDQHIAIATFCLLQGVPCFYWLKECTAPKIREMILELVTRRPGTMHLGATVSVSMFIGNRFHASIIKKLGDRVRRLDKKNLTIPSGGPTSMFNPGMVDAKRRGSGKQKETNSAFRKRLTRDLNGIITGIKPASSEPPISDRVRAKAYDCYLYARDDRYAGKRS
jgi:Schlafen, AlbA_2